MREKGKLERQRRVAFCSLARLEQPAGAECRLGQPAVGNLSPEEAGRAPPRPLCEALSVGSFSAALRRIFLGKLVSFWSLHHQTLLENRH